MSRARSVLAGVVVGLLVSAASVAPAQATYVVGGSELSETETTDVAETIDAAAGVAALNSTIAGEKITIECTANKLTPTGKNTVEGGGRSFLELEYKQCYLYTVSKGKRELSPSCHVAEPIKLDSEGELSGSSGGIAEEKLEAPEGKAITKVTIEKVKGKICLIEGSMEVTGFYSVSLGAEDEVAKSSYEINANSTGSVLSFGSGPASLTYTLSRVKAYSGQDVQEQRPWVRAYNQTPGAEGFGGVLCTFGAVGVTCKLEFKNESGIPLRVRGEGAAPADYVVTHGCRLFLGLVAGALTCIDEIELRARNNPGAIRRYEIIVENAGNTARQSAFGELRE